MQGLPERLPAMADTSVSQRPARIAWSWLQSPWTIGALILLAVAGLDMANFVPVLSFAAAALLSTSKYILFAVTLLAYLKATGAEALVARAFVGRETRMIFFAALLGGLAPFCSCEVIPFIAGLLALGAPLAAVMAFWLSSPLIDPPTLLITAAALGWPFAITKAVSAVALGLFGGFIIKALRSGGLFAQPLKKAPVKSCCGSGTPKIEQQPNWRFWQEEDRRATFRKEFIENGLFLLKWLAFAYVLEALLVTYVHPAWIASLVGGEGIVPIATAALVGMLSLSELLCRAAAAGGADDPRHECRRGSGLHGGGRGQLDPGDGGGLVAGETAGVCDVSGAWGLRRDPVGGGVPDDLTGRLGGVLPPTHDARVRAA